MTSPAWTSDRTVNLVAQQIFPLCHLPKGFSGPPIYFFRSAGVLADDLDPSPTHGDDFSPIQCNKPVESLVGFIARETTPTC